MSSIFISHSYVFLYVLLKSPDIKGQNITKYVCIYSVCTIRVVIGRMERFNISRYFVFNLKYYKTNQSKTH